MKRGCGCVDLYREDWVRALLGDVWHPGGLALTQELGSRLGLGPTDVVLDVASGPGAASRHLAQTFGCRIIATDAGCGSASVRAWSQHLPFQDEVFDAAIIECALSTFEEQERCIREVYRVLRPGGRLGISDMILRDRLPGGFAGSLAELACLAHARDENGYERLLMDAGFVQGEGCDRQDALRELVEQIGRRLFAADLASKLRGGGFDASAARELLKEAIELMDRGVLSYGILTASRPR